MALCCNSRSSFFALYSRLPSDGQAVRRLDEHSSIVLGLREAVSYGEGMKTIARTIIVGLIGAAASVASAAVPSITVTVADSSGKTAYKGTTTAKGTFATGKLQPGGYVVQFNSNGGQKGGSYALVISAGIKKVVANAVQADKLAAGVAMKIEVGAGLNITGQVAAEDKNSAGAPMGKNGKPMVWLPKQIGSSMGARWVESDSPEAKMAQTSSSYSIKNIQDKQNQGVVPNNRGGR
jgi:hypothetical protein